MDSWSLIFLLLRIFLLPIAGVGLMLLVLFAKTDLARYQNIKSKERTTKDLYNFKYIDPFF